MPKTTWLFSRNERDEALRAHDCMKKTLAKLMPAAKVSMERVHKSWQTGEARMHNVNVSVAGTREYIRFRDEVTPKLVKRCKL